MCITIDEPELRYRIALIEIEQPQEKINIINKRSEHNAKQDAINVNQMASIISELREENKRLKDEVNNWMETARQYARNSDYWQDRTKKTEKKIEIASNPRDYSENAIEDEDIGNWGPGILP